jgi:hypothetical protein
MALKSLSTSSTRLKVALGLVLLVGIIGASWWQYNRYLQTEELKLDAERTRVRRVLMEAGIASQKAWAAQGKPVMQEDEMAPQALSDEGELAQAKLWQSLSKDKRELLRTETIKAELSSVPSEDLLTP